MNIKHIENAARTTRHNSRPILIFFSFQWQEYHYFENLLIHVDLSLSPRAQRWDRGLATYVLCLQYPHGVLRK